MKILVSSKSLADCLNKLDLDSDSVQRIVVNDSNITFISRFISVNLYYEIIESKPMFLQVKTRWDCVKKLVNQVDEQPIVLNISENQVEVIFQY